MSDSPANQQLGSLVLRLWEGEGCLRCQHGTTWKSEFTVAHLLNGRLQLVVTPKEEWHSLTDCVSQHEWFELKGICGRQNSEITATRIHFTHTRFSLQSLIGYAHSVILRPEKNSYASDSVSLKYELFNYSFDGRLSPVEIRIGDFDMEISRLTWPSKTEIREHGYAYRHRSVLACLQIRDVSSSRQDEAAGCVNGVLELLSLANRGYVFPAVRHTYGADEEWLDSRFDEPHFTKLGWPRPLIPSEHLEEFLEVTYPNMDANYRSLELAHVIDHYLQALTLRSSWPISLGIFTAMETLKSAFFHHRNDQDAGFQYWVVPPEDFDRPEVIDALVDVLGRHFPRFNSLEKSELSSLTAQLRHNLNRRSYRTQLRRMLEQLGVNYDRDALQAFIDTRNRIIHSGRLTEDEGWKKVDGATSLFERTLLAILGYDGPSELFDAEV